MTQQADRPNLFKYRNSARRLKQSLSDLRALSWDHDFLAQTAGNRIVLVIDVYDLLALAFPYAQWNEERNTDFFDTEMQYDLLRGQIDRSALLFGLPETRSYYPILIPPCYAKELFSFVGSPSVISDNISISEQMVDFDKASMDRLGIAPSMLLERLEYPESLRERELIELFLDVCPDLLFVLSDMFPKGINMIRTAFNRDLVTMDLDKWIRKCQPVEMDRGLFTIEACDALCEQEKSYMVSTIENIRGYFSPSWRADVEALHLVRHMNNICNQQNTIVLFISGASMIHALFEDAKVRELLACSYRKSDGRIERGPFLRGIGVFGYYVQFLNELGINSTKTANAKEMAAMAKRRVSTLQESWRPGVVETDFLNSRVIEVIDKFLEPYAKGVEGVRRLSKDSFSVRGLSSYSRVMIETIMSFEKLQKGFTETAITRRLLFANEFLGWLSVSRLQSLARVRDTLQSNMAAFTLFPFRIDFKTGKLGDHVRRISELFKCPVGIPSDDLIRDFHALVSDLALGCSYSADPSTNFWGRPIKLLDLKDEVSMERRLIWLVLLVAMGHFKQVYQEVRHLLTIGAEILIDEFRVIAIQAMVRELIDKIQIAHGARPTRVLEIIGTCEGWRDGSGYLDVRLRHLQAFALGTLMRRGSDDVELWKSMGEYDRQWAISTCRSVLNELTDEWHLGGTELEQLSWSKRHLIGAVASNLAYYLVIDGLESEVEEALHISSDYGLADEYLTGMCLHNRGYIYLRAMQYSKSIDDFEHFYKLARQCFLKSNERRALPLALEPIFDMSSGKLEQLQQAMGSRLQGDALSLETIYRSKGDDFLSKEPTESEA